VNYLIQDGKSNYLEGGLLIAVYLVLSQYMMILIKDHCRRSMVLSEFGLIGRKSDQTVTKYLAGLVLKVQIVCQIRNEMRFFGEINITRALCEFGEERWHLEQRGGLS
jgi:hypothetical protein